MKLWSDNLSASNQLYAKAFLFTTLGSLMYFYIGVPILLITLIFLLFHMRQDMKEILQQTKWIFVFSVYCFIVAAFNINTIGMFIPFVFLIFAVFFVIYRKKVTAEMYLMLLQAIMLGSILVALHAIGVYVRYVYTHGYDLLYVFKYAAVQTRAEASFFNANYYGLFTIFAILISIYLIARLGDRKWNILAALAIMLNSVTLLLTASRWVLPTLIIAVAILLSFLDKRWFVAFLAASLGLLVLLLIKPELIPRLESLEYAFEDRFALWEVGWKIFLSEPFFGRGPMSYMTFYYLYTDKADMHTHSLYIDALANYGIVGCLAIITYVLAHGKQFMNFIRSKETRPEMALILAMLVTVLFHGLMDVAIFWFQTGYLFLLVILCPTKELKRIPIVLKRYFPNN